MEEIKKRTKKGYVDYISNLPDAVIGRILSLLPTKTSVKMSLLSKRWEKLWTIVPAIDFTEMPSATIGTAKSNAYLSEENFPYFRDFVDKVLSQNSVSCLQCFSCNFRNKNVGYDQIDSWLKALSRREICELNMMFNLGISYYLPDWVFSSERLVVLKLTGCKFKDSGVSLSLPNLEVIHFVHIVFPCDKFLKRLLSNCPVLKEILIDRCFGFENTLYVESLSLKSLTIIGQSSFRSYFSANPYFTSIDQIQGISYLAQPVYQISIKAPNLRYLGLSGEAELYDLGDLVSLSEANLELYDGSDFPALGPHTCELIRKIAEVKTLRFGDYDLSNLTSELPIFPNLTCLKLAYGGYTCELLRRAPILKSLIVENAGFEDESLPSTDVPECLSILESVELTWSKSSENDLVAYMLKAAKGLKEMTIKIPAVSLKQERAIYQDLLNLPKSSTTCQVKVIHLPRRRP